MDGERLYLLENIEGRRESEGEVEVCSEGEVGGRSRLDLKVR